TITKSISKFLVQCKRLEGIGDREQGGRQTAAILLLQSAVSSSLTPAKPPAFCGAKQSQTRNRAVGEQAI
ncbi:MAG: hypothetical protein FWD31_15690, partial [Planctomycetaceae bacterium]|nr:hypothetical protein [Planctomycetaceae bacterium]